MILYHGSSCAIAVPDIRISRFAKDFGQGFYCTALQGQAERWAARFATPRVSMYEFVPNAALSNLRFDTMTEAWLDFIVACRTGKPHGCDIVEDPMTNDQIWNYVADFIAGILTREQFWALAKFKRPTHQVAFCTQHGLGCLRFTGEA